MHSFFDAWIKLRRALQKLKETPFPLTFRSALFQRSKRTKDQWRERPCARLLGAHAPFVLLRRIVFGSIFLLLSVCTRLGCGLTILQSRGGLTLNFHTRRFEIEIFFRR